MHRGASLAAKSVKKKTPTMQETAFQCRRLRFDPWVRNIPGEENGNPLQYSLPGKSHGQRSLAGYSPWVVRVGHNLLTKPPMGAQIAGETCLGVSVRVFF